MSPTTCAASPSTGAAAADRHSRHAALTLALALPADTVLYLLLPMYAEQFGLTLAEAGLLLAANRLVRIAGYGQVARFYARHGDRPTSLLAVAVAALCALGYATLSGFWALLPLRLLWGLCFAALNLSTQALATSDPIGAARRNGRSRALIAVGPVLALPLGALFAQAAGPRPIFLVLAAVALFGLAAARRLPALPHPVTSPGRRFRRPNSLDAWSFMEGLTLDGLFIVGLSYLGRDLLPGSAVVVAGMLMALRYLAEILLSPAGGHMAERLGAERLLVLLSLLTALALVGFGAGWLWSCAAAIVVLRALQLPLLAPIVMRRTPGPARVQALAARAVWRDIGAGTGPLLAGLLLPLASPAWLYGIPALLLALAALACVRARTLPATPCGKPSPMTQPHAIDTLAQLEALYGQPGEAALGKVADHLHPLYQALIAASPFAVLATCSADGLDTSPRGDPPGFIAVQDEKTLLLPERRGNHRIDSLRNIVADPRVALLFLIPGVGETLRVKGRARITVAPELLARFAVDGKPPQCVLVIEVDAVYFQCARAIQRSKLWAPVPAGAPRTVPTAGAILAALSAGAFDGETYDRELPQRQKNTLY